MVWRCQVCGMCSAACPSCAPGRHCQSITVFFLLGLEMESCSGTSCGIPLGRWPQAATGRAGKPYSQRLLKIGTPWMTGSVPLGIPKVAEVGRQA